MADLEEISSRIMNFVEQREKSKNFQVSAEFSYIHLTEELGEIARQLCKKNEARYV